MMRDFFMQTERIGFSKWESGDLPLATQLWGDADVTKLICATGKFSEEDIANRLKRELISDEEFGLQYWPIFELATGELIGCCGLRPHKGDVPTYEIGFHLRKQFWGAGFGFEAATKVIEYGFGTLKASKLFSGHHPNNTASQALLKKLGFQSTGAEFYPATGLNHPSYELKTTF